MYRPHFNYELSSAPEVEPMTAAQAKTWLRVTHADDDVDIALAIAAARRTFERQTKRALITQTWKWRADYFAPEIRLVCCPLQSVEALTYYDGANDLQTLGATNYEADIKSAPARVRPVSGVSWPTTYDRYNAIEIEFKAGYGTASTSIPDDILTCLRRMTTFIYDHRDEAISGTIWQSLPHALRDEVIGYKVDWLAVQ